MEHKSTEKNIREFGLTTLSLKNRNTVILLSILLAAFGIIIYKSMPMEAFPEVNFPNVFVKTVYPGNPPVDMENLVTRPLEKEIHTIKGIKEMKSVSTQDNSDITIEFNTNVDIKRALQDVKDAVDKAKSELPTDMEMDPMVMDFDFNEWPVVSINMSGDYNITELKDYAEYLKDEIEALSEVTKVEIKGLDEREIQVNVDPHKLESLELSFQDIENAIGYENMSISGGDLVIDKTTRSIRTNGEFKSVSELENIVIKNEKGNIVHLRDVAEIVDGFEDPLTYARMDRKPVVSLQVVKKSGENLLVAMDKIFAILAKAKKDKILPPNLNIRLFNDQSKYVRSMVSNLENSIIMGVIFVIGILFLFLGFRNSLFVGIAIPMSMFISFVVLGLIGATINMMVLFGLVLALGMLVDNAIVVVENNYRFIHQGHSLFEAAKYATAEIAIAIISSTATTLAAFFPMIFWPGIVGEFMKHLPITLIIVLSASLLVALVIVPVLTSGFMKKAEEIKSPKRKRSLTIAGIILGAAAFFYIAGITWLGTLLVFFAALVICYYLFLYTLSEWFMNVFLTWLEDFYLRFIRYTLKGKHPIILIGIVTLSLFVAISIYFFRQPNVVFFPVNEPNFVNVFAELPIGTDIRATNEFMYKLEDNVFEVLKPYKPIVESVLTTVGKGVVGQDETPIGNTPQKGMCTVNFVDYEYRRGTNTREIMKKLSAALLGKYPGVTIQVEKDRMGPPTGKPINIEITGKNIDKLIPLSESIRKYLETSNIPGIEGFKMDLDVGMPELLVHIDREKARRFGLSTAQIASVIRTALFGKKASDFKEGEDEYPIKVRLKTNFRNDLSTLMNLKITFRDQTNGQIVQAPISSVADISYSTTYGSINRKDMERAITLWSNVIEGYNAAEINIRLKELMKTYSIPEGYAYKFTGEQEETDENARFLLWALGVALALIMLILVTQFNSVVKPLLIMATVVFSTIGVFVGLAVTKMDFVIIMTGIGVISLAGVVVNNAIVLIDYTDYLKSMAKKRLGLREKDNLPIEESVECIVLAGKTRLRPVLLTAITTILGLVPMAMGLNFNFLTLFSEFNPQIYFGGDNSLFWGPMAWTVIFGLTFSTFLTLIVLPSMYFIGNSVKLLFLKRFGKVMD